MALDAWDQDNVAKNFDKSESIKLDKPAHFDSPLHGRTDSLRAGMAATDDTNGGETPCESLPTLSENDTCGERRSAL
jgi:hypothetical protein